MMQVALLVPVPMILLAMGSSYAPGQKTGSVLKTSAVAHIKINDLHAFFKSRQLHHLYFRKRS